MKRAKHNNFTAGDYRGVAAVSQQTAIKYGFFVLIGFAILKPLSLMGSEIVAIGGVNITDFIGVGVSYLLVVPLLAGLRQIKIDLLFLFLVTFILYAFESILWGSEVRKTAQTILPFIVFFSVRTFITQTDRARMLLVFLVLGFLIPIAFSTYNIVLGKSIFVIEWHNKLPRFSGVFSGPHTLSYIMLFFSFVYCILHHIYHFKNYINRFIISLFLIFSVYCLYKSGTRTTMIGFILFWYIYLWGTNKKALLIAIVLSAMTAIIFHDQIYSIIFKKNEIDLNTATSGRVTLIENNINLFLESSLTQQLVGRGLGHEHRYAYHNDFIALLMDLGLIGLLLYLVLLFYLLYDIFLCKDRKTKYLFGAILISVAAMNFGSNAIVFRIELSQYFWCIMGLFYVIRKNNVLEKSNTTISL